MGEKAFQHYEVYGTLLLSSGLVGQSFGPGNPVKTLSFRLRSG